MNQHDQAAEGRRPEDAPAPPQNLDAEESVLGAMLLSSSAIEAVTPIVGATDFYRESHGRIFRAALELHHAGQPVDAITIADHLDKIGKLADVGGKERIHELAALVPTTSNARHYARIVVEMAALRGHIAAGQQIAQLGWDRDGDLNEISVKASEIVAGLQERTVNAAPIEWATHQEILELELEQERYLVEDLVPAGAVGTIAGVPETHKSWLALQIAMAIARGNGTILGCDVAHQGPVGYLWQDDSTREEAERIKLYEQQHQSPSAMPILWGLNLGLQLPRDVDRIRRSVETNNLALLVIDSYYNFLPGIDLKDEAAEQIVSQLKQQIADTTGCTILIVDHMPWATADNRTRLRAYGGVFKNAATRFGIYIDAVGDKLYLEARGNNIRGFSKTMGYWDAENLELRLIHQEEVEHDDIVENRASSVLEWLEENAGSHNSTAVRTGVGGKRGVTDEALDLLKTRGQVIDHGRGGGSWSGKKGDARFWIATVHAEKEGIQTKTLQLGLSAGNEGLSPESVPDMPFSPAADSTHENGHQELRPEGWDEVGLSPQNQDPGIQDDLDPKDGPHPLRGGANGDEVQAPHQDQDPTPRDVVSSRDLAEAWIRDEGWMLDPDDTTAQLNERWTLGLKDFFELTQLAAGLAAAELGAGPMETTDTMEETR